MGIEHHLKIIQRVLNHDLIRQLYAINGWEWDSVNSVTFKYSDIEKTDLEVFSKAIQRFVSVGSIRKTKALEDAILELLDVEIEEDDEMEFIETDMNSKSGTGMGTSGQGTNKQDNSDTNSDNAS